MPFTKQIIFGKNVSADGHGGFRPYRPEGSCTGICWGTLTMFKGDEDLQSAKR
jgi:hypothetical protein